MKIASTSTQCHAGRAGREQDDVDVGGRAAVPTAAH